MDLLWQNYETQVHGMKSSRQRNLQRKQCMWGPEEGTAENHEVKNLGHQLHIIKKTPKGVSFSCKPTYVLKSNISPPQMSEKVLVLPLRTS